MNVFKLAIASVWWLAFACTANLSAAQQTGDGGATITPGSPGHSLSSFPGAARSLPGSVDTTHSAIMDLISREDVQTELAMSQNQRETINSVIKNYAAGLVLARSAPIRDIPKDELARLSPQEQQQLQAKSITSANTYMAGTSKRISAVLSEKQSERLRELDLQWRTPLALSDQNLAAKFSLTKEQEAQVHDIYIDFQATCGKTVQDVVTDWRGRNYSPGAPAVNPKASMEALQKLIAGLKPVMNRVRTTEGSKVFAVLTRGQQDQWNIAAGKAFVFNDN